MILIYIILPSQWELQKLVPKNEYRKEADRNVVDELRAEPARLTLLRRMYANIKVF